MFTTITFTLITIACLLSIVATINSIYNVNVWKKFRGEKSIEELINKKYSDREVKTQKIGAELDLVDGEKENFRKKIERNSAHVKKGYMCFNYENSKSYYIM